MPEPLVLVIQVTPEFAKLAPDSNEDSPAQLEHVQALPTWILECVGEWLSILIMVTEKCNQASQLGLG